MTAVSELVEEAKREREEQHLAQIAYLSCELSLATIREGVRNTVLNLRHKPKTKYEYNKERVRDFRVNRATDNKKNDKVSSLFPPLRTGCANTACASLLLPIRNTDSAPPLHRRR